MINIRKAVGFDGYELGDPPVGKRLKGHWLIPQNEQEHYRCYLCDVRYSNEHVENRRIPACEAGDDT